MQSCDAPGERVRPAHHLAIPKLQAIVRVGNVIDDPRVGERQRGRREDHAPQPGARELLRERPERGEA